MYQKAIRLNPFAGTGFLLNFANALRDAKRFEEAVSAYRKALQREPNNIFAHTNLAGTYIMMGREKEARAEAAEVLRINQKFSLDNYAKTLSFKDQSVTDRYVAALRKAGLK
jgi:adenylate cyclase